jgi:hypothetical protein
MGFHRGPLGLLLVSLSLSCAADRRIAPDLAAIDDATSWHVVNGEVHVAVEDGASVVRLVPPGGNRKGSNVGMAFVQGLELDEGTIDVDLRGLGEERASFLGVAFGASGEGAFEAVYFRPFHFRQADPVRRAHAVQYVAWPDGTWEALRARAPGVYEAAVDPAPDPAAWFHARIEVTAKTVRVFVDGAPRACLTVERLRTAAKGKVGLWVDSGEGSFARLTILRGR